MTILFLLSCSNNPASRHREHAKTDTLKKSFPKGGMIKNSVVSNTYPAIDDTVTDFLKENLYYSTFINLSFCQKELIKLLNKDDSCKKRWENKVKHLFTMYDNPIDNISTGIEVEFFRDRLNEQSKLQNEYPKGYEFLVKSLPTDLDTSISINKYQSLMLRLKNAGGGNFSELSGIYYTFLIIDGSRFINAIERNPKCVIQFKRWIDSIEETEFVAYAADNVPPQIIERKRNYLIDKYSSVTDSLMKEAIYKIKSAKIRSID